MSSVPKNIKELYDLLKNSISNDAEIADVQMTRLTAPGENYGSAMMRMDIRLKNKENGKEEMLYGVAKLIPPNPDMQKIFNTQVTFKNEIAFYATVVPTLVEFQKEEGMEGIKCFAKLLGSRINLDGSDVVNEDAVLMLENLKMIGYSTVEPQKGYDLEMAKLILRDLAEFHGVSLGLKLRKPSVFNEKIRPYLHTYEPATEEHQIFLQLSRTILSENEECIPLIPKITAWGTKNSNRKAREPFATMFHQDLWVNNMMQKYEDGKPVANKFVDFQVIDYGSPAADVFFFVFTNVQLPVLKNHLDHLLLYYHECLIQILKELHCPTAPFSFESFLEEIRIEAEYEFPHALMFSTFVVFMGQRPPEEYDDLELDPEKMLPLIDAANRERAQYITLECERRGWLY